ncbi:MAG: secondary thiamine-phosphate synthase enzyme YjbQ [candidate division Zixibacteria bacterium]|nr:secondary thiamine-phosphate synthase enzyme YjbQ [candidate division Zixibacteria bacterium]MCK4427734.1 secondary thiamine-phosphate synthase enzyme YjbQ [candidate division Zixibacteria bacterium]
MMKQISVRTSSRVELIDITHLVEKVTSESKIKSGLCTIYVPHTTAAVTINENADPSVRSDIIAELNKIVPFDDNYSHLEGNAAAHIKASMIGPSENILVDGGSLVLGTWQGIYFCEFDGPRSRKVMIKIVEG